MSHPSESFSSPLSPTGQQVIAVLGHQILLWETAFYYDMLMIDTKTSYEINSVCHPIVFSNIHPFQPEVLSPTFTHWVLFWFFDKIISAWIAKSDFIAYSHIFQMIINLKYRFMNLDFHIKRMLMHLLYNSILCFSYSDIILVNTPACVFAIHT